MASADARRAPSRCGRQRTQPHRAPTAAPAPQRDRRRRQADAHAAAARDRRGQPEQLKGVRRNMARVMADAHAEVVPTTLMDDADLHAWSHGEDITARLIRALVAAAARRCRR